MTTDIIETITANPVTVLIDEKAYSEFYERVKAHVFAFVPDTSTAKGRSEIASMAFKVVRSKTAIDAAGKKLNEDARAKINAVDAQRRKIREELDALANEVRRPLTEWEDAEKARREKADHDLAIIADLLAIHPGDTSSEIRRRLDELTEMEILDEVHGDQKSDALDALNSGIAALEIALDRAVKYEADQAELAKLRAEAEARAESDRLAREDADRAAKEEAERVAAEKRAEEDVRRIADTQDMMADQIIDYIKTVRAGMIGGTSYPYGILLRELEIKIPIDDYAPRHHARIEEAKREAHEYLTAQMNRDAAIRAEREAAESRDRESRAAENARIEAERAAAERVAKADAEAARVKAEADRAERERLDQIDRTKREEAARQADRAHRSTVMKEAKDAIMEHGVDEDAAKKTVLAIVAGEIPHVTLRF